MANAEQVKKTAVTMLHCLEKVTSFASSINPMFGIFSSLIGVVRKRMGSELEAHACDKDFQEVHSKLASISEQNHQCLKQIHIDEVHQTFGIYEEYIKHQYEAFNNMVKMVKKDPENAQDHMKEYKSIYQLHKQEMSLDVYYRGVMGIQTVFGRPLLKVFLDHCECDRKIMEHRCSHLVHLFQIGLIALMAYTVVTEDEEDVVTKKWGDQMEDIRNKMVEVLSQCKEDSST